jgi:hypothetical protein
VVPLDVPAFGVEPPGDDVDVPGDVELGVFTVPSDAMQGVELPGAVVPGKVLGGVVCAPGVVFCVPEPFCGFGWPGVVPDALPEPLFIGEQGGKLPGVDPGPVEPGVVEPGPVDPGAAAPGIAVPGVGTAG